MDDGDIVHDAPDVPLKSAYCIPNANNTFALIRSVGLDGDLLSPLKKIPENIFLSLCEHTYFADSSSSAIRFPSNTP